MSPIEVMKLSEPSLHELQLGAASVMAAADGAGRTSLPADTVSTRQPFLQQEAMPQFSQAILQPPVATPVAPTVRGRCPASWLFSSQRALFELSPHSTLRQAAPPNIWEQQERRADHALPPKLPAPINTG